MANDIDIGKIQSVMYSYSIKLYTAADEVIFENVTSRGRILAIEKHNRPIEADKILPYTKILISVTNDELVDIQTNRDNLLMQLSVTSDQLQTNKEGVTEIIGNTVLWDTVFQVMVMDNEIPMLKDENKKLMNADDGSEITTQHNKFNNISLVLYELDILNIFKKKNPFIFNECSPLTALTRILNFYGVTNVIADEPDITTVYPQIIIPKGNVKDNIKHLQNVYGIYKTGVTMYFDIGKRYILKNNNTAYAFEEDTYNKVSMTFVDNIMGGSGDKSLGYYKDDDNTQYVILQNRDVLVNDRGGVKKETVGNIIHVYTNELAEKSLLYEAASEKWTYTKPYAEFTNDMKGNDKSEDNIFIYENSLSNDAIATELMSKVKLSTNIIGKLIINTELGVVSFNKVYDLQFAYDENVNKKRQGKYRLLDSIEILAMTKGTKNLTPAITATFCKM